LKKYQSYYILIPEKLQEERLQFRLYYNFTEFGNSSFFDSADIGSAYAQNFPDFSLGLFTTVVKTVP
jgi:hypothetical protein